jgi:hypothetical protein
VRATTCGVSWDTVLHTRTGTGTQLGCNDDGCGYRASDLTSTFTGPGLFGVYVDGFSSSSSGSYTLNISGL